MARGPKPGSRKAPRYTPPALSEFATHTTAGMAGRRCGACSGTGWRDAEVCEACGGRGSAERDGAVADERATAGLYGRRAFVEPDPAARDEERAEDAAARVVMDEDEDEDGVPDVFEMMSGGGRAGR